MWLSIYFLFCLVMALAYVLTIAKIHSGWSSIKELQLPKAYVPSLKITVVIAARNEELGIERCVRSVLNNNYPSDLLEVIVVDDHSTDATGDVLSSISDSRFIVLKQEVGKEGKKAALSKAIYQAKGELILTTDADCITRKNWIRTISYAYDSQQIEMATAPVVFNRGMSWVEKFQILDLSGMMAVTAHGIKAHSYYLANGANMSFTKKAFMELGGFSGNEKYASGDDMFLIHKMAKSNPAKVAYIKTTAGTVETRSETLFKDLMNQRKRWATKSKAYSDKALQKLLVFIFLFNVLLIGNLTLSPIIGEIFFFIFALQFFMKMIIDYLFLKNMSSYFDRRKAMKGFFISSFLASANILYSGWVSIFSKSYTWKERSVS